MTPYNAAPATTPSEHKPRKVVLCFDDAAYPFQSNFSNVLKLFMLLRDDDDQIVYYDPGVGIDIKPGFWSFKIRHSILRKLVKFVDEAFALYLCQQVMAGYEFLVKYYNPGDEVYAFGFSRGAYTARVVAAMLHKVGLISRDKLDSEEKIQNNISLAYDRYMSATPNDEAIALEFKKKYCCPVRIDFMGVWDTVSSVGFLWSQTLPFVDANSSIQVFRQALSLDEHRARFRPNLFRHGVLNKSSDSQETDDTFQTDVKEVWFAGTHSDVGGGNVPETAEHDITNISLRWMIEELVRSGYQIKPRYENFEWRKLPSTEPLSPPPWIPSTEDIDALNAQDALQPITDEPFKNPLWWFLEIIPTSYTYQDRQGKWVTTYGQHFGRRRRLPPGPLLHTSVKTRMDDPSLGYKPRAWYEQGTERFVS